jgi:hypothetical protein
MENGSIGRRAETAGPQRLLSLSVPTERDFRDNFFSAPNNNSCVHITQLLNRFWLLRFIEYIKMFTKRK